MPGLVPNAHGVEGATDDGLVLATQPPEESGMRLTTQSGQFEYRQPADLGLIGQHHPDGTRAFPLGIRGDRLIQQVQFTPQRRLGSGKCTEQGRFSGTVSPQQAGQLATPQLEVQACVHLLHGFPGLVADAKPLSLYDNSLLFHQLKYWIFRWLTMT